MILIRGHGISLKLLNSIGFGVDFVLGFWLPFFSLFFSQVTKAIRFCNGLITCHNASCFRMKHVLASKSPKQNVKMVEWHYVY